MKIHDQVILQGMEGRVSKILPDGKLEVTLVRVVNRGSYPTNVAIVEPITVYRICEYK